MTRAAAVLLAVLALAGSVQAGGLAGFAGRALEDAGLGDALTPLRSSPVGQTLVNHNCGGTAPVTAVCTATLAAPPGASYAVTISVGTGFAGTVHARLRDAYGNYASASCTFLPFVGGVTPPPTCAQGGSGKLAGGALTLEGSVGDAASGAPSLGYWEVHVLVPA